MSTQEILDHWIATKDISKHFVDLQNATGAFFNAKNENELNELFLSLGIDIQKHKDDPRLVKELLFINEALTKLSLSVQDHINNNLLAPKSEANIENFKKHLVRSTRNLCDEVLDTYDYIYYRLLDLSGALETHTNTRSNTS